MRACPFCGPGTRKAKGTKFVRRMVDLFDGELSQLAIEFGDGRADRPTRCSSSAFVGPETPMVCVYVRVCLRPTKASKWIQAGDGESAMARSLVSAPAKTGTPPSGLLMFFQTDRGPAEDLSSSLGGGQRVNSEVLVIAD